MGGSHSSDGKTDTSTEQSLAKYKGSGRQKRLEDIVRKQQEDGENFYTLFGLPKYAEITEDNTNILRNKYRQLLLRWHPDKNPTQRKEQCEIMTAKICLGKETLETVDLKRRYDMELHKADGNYSNSGWYFRWGYSILAALGGLATVIACACTGGTAAVPIGVLGSAVMSSGMSAGCKMICDPSCSDTEFGKDVVVGALAGAACGGVGAGASAAMAGWTTGAKIGLAAVAGATCAVTSKGITDGVDLVLTSEAFRNTQLAQRISDARSREEIFSSSNTLSYVKHAVIGASLGVAFQGIAESKVAEAGDEVVGTGQRVLKIAEKTAKRAAAAVVKKAIATKVIAISGVFRGEGMQQQLLDFQEAQRLGDRKAAERVITRLERMCYETILLDSAEQATLRMFLSDLQLDSFQKISQWVAANIKYAKRWVGHYLRPNEIIARREGVCLEFATLVFNLTELVEPSKAKVIIGLRRKEIPESCHAWVTYEGVPWEPQSAKQVAHNSETDWRPAGNPDAPLQRLVGYVPWFTYDASRSKILNGIHTDKRGRFVNFFASGGKATLTKGFHGYWEDDHRGFVVYEDLTVHFQWSHVRDTKTFRATEGVYDETTGLLSFTLTFPPDTANPEGCAHWHLREDGRVILTFGFKLPNGESTTQHTMRRRPFQGADSFTGLWADDKLHLRILPDLKIDILWSSECDKEKITISRGKYEVYDGSLTFDLHFPASVSNPQPLARWRLYDDGAAVVTSDGDEGVRDERCFFMTRT